MKNGLISLGIILVFICFGIVIYNDVVPDISTTVLMCRTWFGVICGYAGVIAMAVGSLLKPNYFRTRSQYVNW